MKRLLQSLFFPGGVIFLAALLLLGAGWLNPSVYGVKFFYYAVFLAAVLLAWRFHSTRILLAALVLFLAHHAIESFTQGQLATGSRLIAFDIIALVVPLNFAFLSFFPERGYQGRSLSWFLALLFFESVFVAASARPEQPAPQFLRYAPLTSVHSRLPQPALFVFILVSLYLFVRLIQRQRPTIAGLFWSLIATCLAFEAGAAGKTATAYFGSAALILATSIVENSYSLAYRDELTGLQSRRAFNDAVLRLKPPYAVAAVDIDHFKSINDTYGHDIGDEVLRMVASKLARVGGGGEAYRVGGEEFTILFPGQNGRGVVDYLELLRLEIESSTFRVRSGQDRRKVPRPPDRRFETKKKKSQPPRNPAGMLSVTVSIGIGESQPKATSEEIINQADQALYQAKRGGRNRIETGAPERKILGFRRKPKQS